MADETNTSEPLALETELRALRDQRLATLDPARHAEIDARREALFRQQIAQRAPAPPPPPAAPRAADGRLLLSASAIRVEADRLRELALHHDEGSHERNALIDQRLALLRALSGATEQRGGTALVPTEHADLPADVRLPPELMGAASEALGIFDARGAGDEARAAFQGAKLAAQDGVIYTPESGWRSLISTFGQERAEQLVNQAEAACELMPAKLRAALVREGLANHPRAIVSLAHLGARLAAPRR